MKKLLFVAVVMFLACGISAADTCRITYLKGNVFFATTGDAKKMTTGENVEAGDAVQTAPDSRAVFLFSQGAEIRTNGACAISMQKSDGTLNVKLEKGQYFINAPYAGGKKHTVVFDGGRLTFNRGIVEIKDDKAVFYSGRPDNASQYKAKSEKFPDKPDEWQVFNSLRDKRDLCLIIKAPVRFEGFYFDSIKKGALALYPVSDVLRSDKAGCGVSCYVRVSPSAGELKTVAAFNRFSADKAKLTEISSPYQANEELFAANSGVVGVLRALEIEFDETAALAFREGIEVTVEAEVKNENQAAMLADIIKKIRGVKGVETTLFYGQKAVFKVKTWGTGYDIKEALDGIKTVNLTINVWNFGRDIVKLRVL